MNTTAYTAEQEAAFASSAQDHPSELPADPRYSYATCPKCERNWQLIDWGCSLHVLVCGHPVPATPKDQPSPRGARNEHS